MRSYTDFNEFATDLERETGIKVYQYRTEGDVYLPYIVCGESRDASVRADDGIHQDSAYVDILLFTYQGQTYSDSQKAEAVNAVKKFLIEGKLPFNIDSDWLEQLELFQTSFFTRIFYGI